MQPFPDLRPVLTGIDWLVAGAVATRAFMPERATTDLDILVRESDAAAVTDRLTHAGYINSGDLGVPGAAFVAPGGVAVDVLYGRQPWLDEALARPARDAAGFPVLDLPYLVLMKLASGRARDVGDVATMLGWADDDALAVVRAAVAHHTPADREDLESLIYLGRLERG